MIIWEEEERYQKSSYNVCTHFSTSSCDMFCTHAKYTHAWYFLREARVRYNVKYSFNLCKYCELSSGTIAATFQRTHPSLYF